MQGAGFLAAVLEADVLELHPPREQRELHGLGRRLDIGPDVEHLEGALCAGHRLAGSVDQPGQLLGRAAQHEQVAVEGHQRPDGQLAVQHHLAAKPQDQQGAGGDQELGGGHDLGPFAHHGHPAVEQGAVGLPEALHLIRLAGKGAHHLHAADVFLQAGRQVAQGAVHVEEKAADAPPEIRGDQDQRDHGQQGDGRQASVGGKEQGGDARQQQGDARQVNQSRAGKALDGAHIFDAAADELAGLRMVVVGEREVLDVVIQAVAQVVAHALGHPLGSITLEVGQRGFEQADAQDEQGRLDHEADLALQQANVNHLANDGRNDQAEAGDGQEQQQGKQELPVIGLDEGA